VAKRLSPSGIILPKLEPTDAEAAVLARVNEAIALHEQAVVTGDWWSAEKAYRRILDKYPGSSRTRAMLGLLMQQKSEQSDPAAIEAMIDGAEGDPHDALIQAQLGAVLYHVGRIRESAEAYRRSVEANPSYDDAYAALGRVLTDSCDHDAAVYAYERALQIRPDDYSFWSDLVFITDLAPGTTFEDALRVRRAFNDRMVLPRLAEALPHTNDRDPDRQLRIGYASADMYQHSGAMTWGGFLVNHDRSQVHVTLYSSTEKEDVMTAKFKSSCDQWHDVRGWTDDQLAIQVYRDRIDILVDLASFTKGGKLLTFARKPAPIQLSGWGYATGLALDCMDYFATDGVVVPKDVEGRYHEQPWRLPSALSWVHPNDDVPVSHLRAALGRPVTFGVFNRQPKITRAALKAWVEIVRRVPGSTLLVKNQKLESDQLREIMRELCVQEGARYDTRGGAFPQDALYVETGGDPSRIIFAGSSTHYEQMAAHWVVDVMLDPFPQGGGVSSFESLWMGCPIVTLTDERPPGRITTSLLHQVGLPDFAVGTVEAYIERAVEAARDIERLKLIRESLRERVRAMPALQLRAYSAAVEKGYREMWRRWCAQQQSQEAA
jgi:protein O-GlcNAc transferase